MKSLLVDALHVNIPLRTLKSEGTLRDRQDKNG